MKLTSETWEALAKFFLTMANGLILAGIVAYVFEEKNLFAGIIVVGSDNDVIRTVFH